MNKQIQKASFAPPEDDYWQDYLRTNRAKEGERLEDAAKFLSGMISISLTIFLKINDEAFTALAQSGYAIVVVGLWLGALGGSFLVFFPFGYSVHESVPSSIEAFHQQMVRRKRRWLLGSTLCFFAALVLLGMAFVGETL